MYGSTVIRIFRKRLRKTVYVQIIHNEMQKSKINRHFLCFFHCETEEGENEKRGKKGRKLYGRNESRHFIKKILLRL